MIPHPLVLKPGLVIHSIYNGYWFWGRPTVVDLWHDLRAVTREIRPDCRNAQCPGPDCVRISKRISPIPPYAAGVPPRVLLPVINLSP